MDNICVMLNKFKSIISIDNIKMFEFAYNENKEFRDIINVAVRERSKYLQTLLPNQHLSEIYINADFKQKIGMVCLPYYLAKEMVNSSYLDNRKARRKIENGTICVINSLNGILPILLKEKYPNARIICLEYFSYHIQDLKDLGFETYQVILKDNKLILLTELVDMQIKPDLTFANPPYNAGLDLKFLDLTLNTIKSTEFIFVQPSTYLLDRKGGKSFNKIKEQLYNKLRSVKLFNGNPIFGIDLFVPCAIIHYDKNYTGDCEVDYFGDKYKSDIWNITKFGKEWETIVKPFMNKMKEVCKDGNNAWSRKISTEQRKEKDNKYYCQLAAIIGNHSKDNTKMYNDDIYRLIIGDGEKNKGIRNETVRKDGYIVYEFDTEKERDNLIEYCKTYFVRFCLSLYKNTQNIHYGEMLLIPYMDFTQEWTDEKLFKHFSVDEETQEYIYEFLPDYYGIKKNV